MTQEDGFIEVRVYLTNRRPIIKWVRPVVIKRIRLLFDVYCMMIVARTSGLDFTEADKMEPQEMLTWMVYGGYSSYRSLSNKRPGVTVEDVQEWVRGILHEDRIRILEAVQESREIGQLAKSYQEARSSGEGDGSKKVAGSDQQS